MDATDLTTMVGDNDSGKSNILRALNLFFNGQTDPGIHVNFDQDFNKFVKLNRRAPQIDIELLLELPEGYRANNGDYIKWTKSWRDGTQPEPYNIVGMRKVSGRGGRAYLDEVEILPKSKVPALLSRVEYEYIPAVRSADFFRVMRGRIYKVISDVAEEGFRARSADFERAIAENVSPLLFDILEKVKDNVDLRLPKDLSDIFEKLDFLNGEAEISLNSRGDGIKARYIPLILKFIADKKQTLYGRGGQPYTFIWGYEEPENNLEFRRAQELAELFKNLAEENLTQVLITTHSPVFFNMGQESGLCSSHFINRSSNEAGTVSSDSGSVLESLDSRMGVMPIIAPYVKKAQLEVLDLRERYDELDRQLTVQNVQNRPTVFVEGASDFAVISALIGSADDLYRDRLYLSEPPLRAGADYVANMLRAWECRVKHLDGVRPRAFGLTDDDEAGKRAETNFTKDYRNPKYTRMRTISRPNHLDRLFQAGFNIPICLEELYPIEWWRHAEAQGWLIARDRVSTLSENAKNSLLNQETTWERLVNGEDWEIVLRNKPNEEFKTRWAAWVARKPSEQLLEGLQHLRMLLSTELAKLF
jgi:energy-coupling factor transporter ATP-binding protein EcfA2